jgi:5-methylcytosine-specific restriction endonuclease McrA
MGSPKDDILDDVRRGREERERGYREQALKIYPWLCGRCGRDFGGKNLRMLTVHHRDHNHDNNPPDGSNWELLCLYCHDDEHTRSLSVTGSAARSSRVPGGPATNQPFAGLKELLDKKIKQS